jgi:3-oxoacyl-[acyl-carrier-protein] synthase II
MKRCYINGIGCVSTQNTTDGSFLDAPIFYDNEVVLNVVKPNYSSFIDSSSEIRRMSGCMKNGMVSSTIALTDNQNDNIEAIIVGTGMGCIYFSEKFLKSIIENNEEFLTPTPFIQSTHNAVAGQLAIKFGCKGYNFTYVDSASSFLSALFDGMLQIQNGEISNALIGGVDEMAEHTTELFQHIEHFKQPNKSFNFFSDKTKGHVLSEGASFFVLEDKKKETSYCEVVDVMSLPILRKDSSPTSWIYSFLTKNQIPVDEIDLLILGNNGDENYDVIYDEVEKNFSHIPSVFYKHLFGEFLTSSGIAVWLACNIFKNQYIPQVLCKPNSTSINTSIKTILIYNQYRGENHSLILLKNV